MYKNLLGEEAITQIKNAKYVAGEYTYIDNLMNPMWIKLTTLLPRTIAPNLITFLGFLFAVHVIIPFTFYDNYL